MTKVKAFPQKIILLITALLFGLFLAVPMGAILWQSLQGGESASLECYRELLSDRSIARAFGNSVLISAVSGFLTTVLAFLPAYAVNYTNLKKRTKKIISSLIMLPMLLPTITYGFAIIYSMGKQGVFTKILGVQIVDIYGVYGLVIGYVIYTLPISFMLINNTMGYIDKKYMIVSRMMGDGEFRCFVKTVLVPLIGTFAVSFIQSFTLSFTDYGIPAALAGNIDLLATRLYGEMLGSLPDFAMGSAVSVLMLVPSAVSILLISWLNRYNIRYNKISVIELRKNRVRDLAFGAVSAVMSLCILAIFAVIFLVPFVEQWPYRMNFSMTHVAKIFADDALMGVYKNSIFVAFATALLGTLIAYGTALISARNSGVQAFGKIPDGISLITNTIPGMVLGVGYLLAFKGTPLHNTFWILILCNIIHYFSSPYLMMKGGLEKLNASWETTARLMGDSWLKTVVRIITPNAMGTVLEVFGYYFVNSMVTVSAVIFLASTRTMIITAKIKELQHFANFNEIFVLSVLILLTNLLVKGLIRLFAVRTMSIKQERRGKHNMNMKKLTRSLIGTTLAASLCAAGLTGCSGKQEEKQVIIYSNADDEAVESMKKTLDANGYEGKYVFQSFGTSELGGKMLAEGKDIEADVITMSTYYLESAQSQSGMFRDLDFQIAALEEYPSYYAPFLANQGALLINTEVLKENNLPTPTSVKDLADPQYAGFISVVDIQGSSTAWLMIQSLVDAYGEDGAKEVLTDIYKNAGAHLEQSGSGPIKKVRAGEVAIGFGLRHQAVADKEEGLPIDFVDPAEGNFTLKEGLAVVEKGDKTNPLAMEMVKCIIEKGRPDLMTYYPVPLYEGENADADAVSANSKVFPEPLTVELLEKHQALSESCK